MLRCLEVSGLTRPARIRCRPILLIRPKSTVSPPPRTSPSSRARSSAYSSRKSGSAGTGGEEGLGQITRRRRELSDYEEAKQLQKLRAENPEVASPPPGEAADLA